MASPVTVRHPLAQRSINTQSFTTSTTSTPSTYKPLVGQKRTHSQSTGQENSNHVNGNSHNIQQQILTNPATFKQPSVPRHPHYALQAAAPQKCRSTARPAIQVPPQFKQPLPRTSVIATRQRQQTNDPAATTAGEEGDTQEVIEWRRQMKRTLSISTFYFDCVEESFKETSSRIIYRHGGKVAQFFSNSVNIIITTRETPPPPTFTANLDSSSKQIKSKTESFKGNLSHISSPPSKPIKDILLRARDLGIRIWQAEKFKRILQCVSPVARSPAQTINPSHLSAALEAEKRHGRTTETDPSVPREEYVYFQGPYILVTDLANVHKPIMVREYPQGSNRPETDDQEALWPMFWAGREGSCPYIRPVNRPQKPTVNAATAAAATETVVLDPMQKHYARPNVVVPTALAENRQVGNKMIVLDQPASGIINSSNAFSAIRSTTTCGSNITSTTLSALGGGAGTQASLSRPVRDLKSRLTAIPAAPPPPPTRQEMPPPKKRKVETLREQLAKTKKKPQKEGYCENCKERYDEYEEHTQTRRHRKYARNGKNFVQLDELLEQLKRPLLAERGF